MGPKAEVVPLQKLYKYVFVKKKIIGEGMNHPVKKGIIVQDRIGENMYRHLKVILHHCVTTPHHSTHPGEECL